MRDYYAGITCIIIAIVFLALLMISLFVPNPPGLAYGAIVAGVGTIISLIMLAISLFVRHT